MTTENAKRVPELRFPGFVGAWNRTRLDDSIDSIDSGWSPQCSDQPAEPNEWGILKTTSVVWNGYNEGANKRLLPGSEPREQIEVKVRDILITRAGPSERVGVVAHVDRTRPMLMLSDKIIRLRCNDLADSQFIARCVSSKESQDHLLGRKSGLAKSQTNISQNDLRSVPLTIPTLPEQRKIADFLTAVDGRIQQLSQKKALLEDYKKGVMQQLFTQALRFQDDHGNQFPDWEEKTLGELLTFKNGFNAEKSQYGTGVKFINVLDVLSPRPISLDTIIGRVEIPAKDFPKFEVKYGDLLFQRSSETREEVGQANVYVDKEQSAGFGGFVIRGQPKAEFDPLFMNYLLRTPIARNEITTKSGGSTRYNVSQDTLGEARVVMPSSLPEQTKIANFLTALDRKIESVAHQITHTQTFKKGLLQQMFV